MQVSALSGPCALFPAEVHEDATEVVRVLLYPVVEGLDLLLLKETQDVFLQGTRTLPGDDLHQGSLLGNGLVDDGAKCPVYLRALVVDVVQVEFELHRCILPRPQVPCLP